MRMKWRTDETDRGVRCPQNPDGWEGVWWGDSEGVEPSGLGDSWLSWVGGGSLKLVHECHRAQQVQEWNVYKSKEAFEGQCGAWLNKSLFNSINKEQTPALPISLPPPVWMTVLSSPDERLRCTLWRHRVREKTLDSNPPGPAELRGTQK